MAIRIVNRQEPTIDDYAFGGFICRQIEEGWSGPQLILHQLYTSEENRGQGRMTKILRRYLRRLPNKIQEVWTIAHPFRCEDGLHWTEVVSYARWLRRLGFELQDRSEFFRCVREAAENNDGYVCYRHVCECWMVLER